MNPPVPETQRVSAYIPCYNNARTIGLAIQSLQHQTHPMDELFVIDDGSTDHSVEVVEGFGVRVIRLGKNQGRGAARAAAMEAARNELVLCCDATNRLAPDFTERALKWFASDEVLAAYGHWHDPHPRTVNDRWRARHLFRLDVPRKGGPRSSLCTYGTVVRKSVVLKAGNFDRHLRHGEDYHLGRRLLKLGNVVMDPTLHVEPLVSNTLPQLMERYARWNRASLETYTLRTFLTSHVLAWRILIPRDLRNGDWPAALISALVPYFCFAYADKKSLTFAAGSEATKVASIPSKP